MNRQAYSILFCVLFASTFFHEIRAKAAANPEFARVRRSNSTPEPSTGPVQDGIHLNITGKLQTVLIISNEKANVSLIVNATASAAILIDGNTRIAIVIDLQAKVEVVYFENINVKDFLDNPQKGLEAALGSNGGIVSSGTNATEKVLKGVNDVVINLVANIEVELEVNRKRGVELMFNISKELIVLLNGDLNGLPKHIDGEDISYEKDVVGLTNFLQGLGKCVKRIPGAIATVSKTLNLQVLLRLDNGLKILLALLGQLGEHSKELTFLNDPENFFLVVALFGGLQNSGISGLNRVQSSLMYFIKGKMSLELLVTVIIQDLARWHRSEPVPDASEVHDKTANSILSLLEKLGLTSELRGLVTHLNSLLDKTLIVGGVNFSAITTLLLKVLTGTSSSLLETLVGVLMLLKPIVTNEVALVRGLLTLLFHLTTDIGRQLLKALGFVADSEFGVVSDVLANLLKLVGKILDLLKGNLFEALLKIPIIGGVVERLAGVITSVTGGKIDLKVILNNPTLKVLILGFIQLETSLPLNIATNIRLQIESSLKTCTSIPAYIGFYPDVL